MKKQQLVSVICDLTVYNEQIAVNLSEISRYLTDNYYASELIVIANGLGDNCYSQLKKQLNEFLSIRLIRLNSRVNTDTAITAGLDNAIGDYVVLFDPCHDPVKVIGDVVAENTKLNGFVIGVSVTSRESFLNRAANYIGKDIPTNATKLRCLSRHTINMLLKSGGYHHNVLFRLHKLGLNHSTFNYAPISTQEIKLDSFKYLIRNVVFGDPKLIRRTYQLGAIFAILCSAIITVMSGFSDSLLYILFCFLFISVGGITELLLRLIDHLSEKDRYIVTEELSTALATDNKRLNVVDE
ncbi:glycosyltransferase [Shewanella fidelis]|uniref:Glycosyltransferase n=1 Tax=Shewanella fidelis TaxID=173509 RepID=A0AAW8NNX6_9GAMM|nr:glycosyltransferase [Shewanella fidelis]MDR8524427.1 glycosyltransferase [Shewanella fidelis]MDW4811903.1 glycosyltransferase [Shewanella fidelis]MDW4817158.1 glycosyltransferase [Shewanella fidelis]MDW4821228.1 glycosyltransferase [Shewanella fidelis]MDW4822509.1 glycosyltransferase [Shewanella fidelis]